MIVLSIGFLAAGLLIGFTVGHATAVRSKMVGVKAQLIERAVAKRRLPDDQFISWLKEL